MATILSAAISSKAIDSGLRATEVTCGGTIGAEAVAELAEVGVDLAGPSGGQRDQAELRVDLAEEVLDRRVHHRVVRSAMVSELASQGQVRQVTGGARCAEAAASLDAVSPRALRPGGPPAARALVDQRLDLVDRLVEVVVDHHVAAELGGPTGLLASALASRCATLSSGGSPRPRSRALLDLAGDGRLDEDRAARRGSGRRTCAAPWTSISSTTSRPGGGSGSGRAVEVAEELGPLEEAAVGDRGARTPRG